MNERQMMLKSIEIVVELKGMRLVEAKNVLRDANALLDQTQRVVVSQDFEDIVTNEVLKDND